ncbi:MAG TPA: ferritin-like domain-containing protein [Symbiobacteriaceae bacterium]|nr:ferritin-like domain-containing protein [Symbiobacteriaceae bacterium]
MFQPHGAFGPNLLLPPHHVQGLLNRMGPILATIWRADRDGQPDAQLYAGAILGGYLFGRGYPPERAAAWIDQWVGTSGATTEWQSMPAMAEVATRQPQTQSGHLVQSAEADDTYRTLLTDSMNGEATASIFYANIADALQEDGLEQAAQWVREASKDEQRHLTLLQQRYRTLFGSTYKPVIGSTAVEDLKTALTEALGDEFGDARKYRDAYLAHTDPADQRLFFELATDELRHGTIMTYSLQALR